MQFEEHRNSLVACANKEEATLFVGMKEGFFSPAIRQGIFNAEKIGFKNSFSSGEKIHLKEYEIWFGVVGFFLLTPSKFMFVLD